MSMGGMIGAGLQLAGGLFGASEAEDAIDEQHWQFQENQKQQREFAQHGVRWRVEDAKAAGLHPLFALGANLPSHSPVSGVQFAGSPMGEALSRMGQDVSRAAMASQTPEQKQLVNSSIDAQEARAANDWAQAAYWWSKAGEVDAPGSGPGIPNAVVNQGDPNVAGPFAGFYDRTNVQASPTYSRDSTFPQAGAGSAPFWRSFQLRKDGLMIDLPFSEEGPSESLQDLPYWMYPEVIRHNTERYGGGWLTDFLKAYPESPIGEWLRRKAGWLSGSD